MKYFKNTELARLYNISEKSVRNWIQAVAEGKLDLQLTQENGKTYITNSPKNALAIRSLADKGKKYRNSRALKTVIPSPDFYKLCNPKQIYDLISNIDIHREIPHQYSYLDGGAKHWDQYALKLFDEKTSNSITNTIQLLDINEDYIMELVSKHRGVNVIDVGVGNCVPVRKLLQKLLEEKKLRRYIGLDISPDMLALAEDNIRSWFEGKVHFEGYVRDVNYDRFEDLLISDSFSDKDASVVNLILFFGGTISNLRAPDQALRTMNNSMSRNDIFILSRKLDTAETRRYFDFTIKPENALDMKEKIMLDLLGINEEFYSVEQFFDQKTMARKMHVRLKLDLCIKFHLSGQEKSIELHKGDTLLVWRSDHQSLKETILQLENNGFDTIQATKSIDEQYALFVSKLKTAP